MNRLFGLMCLLGLIALPASSLAQNKKVVRAEVGKTAPDFTLALMGKKEKVTLSKMAREKPVLLIFGSYT